jgi:hypothetical protein
MGWWLNRTGQPEGPFEDAQLLQLIGSGQVRGGQICQAGGNAWTPIEHHPVFGAALAGGGATASPGHARGPEYAAGPAPVPGPGYAPVVAAPVAGAAPRKRSSVWLVVAIAVSALACAGALALFFFGRETKPAKPNPALSRKETAKRAKDFEAKLAKLKKIGAAPFPTIEDSYSKRVPTPVFSGSLLTGHEPHAIVYTKDFEESDLKDDTMRYRVSRADTVALCVEALGKWKKLKDTKESLSTYLLGGCADFNYVFVIRVTRLETPEVTSKEGTNVTFDAGHVEGDVAAFDVDSGNFLGGYHFAATSTAALEVTSAVHPENALRHDMENQLMSALNTGHERAAAASSKQ